MTDCNSGHILDETTAKTKKQKIGKGRRVRRIKERKTKSRKSERVREEWSEGLCSPPPPGCKEWESVGCTCEKEKKPGRHRMEVESEEKDSFFIWVMVELQTHTSYIWRHISLPVFVHFQSRTEKGKDDTFKRKRNLVIKKFWKRTTEEIHTNLRCWAETSNLIAHAKGMCLMSGHERLEFSKSLTTW